MSVVHMTDGSKYSVDLGAKELIAVLTNERVKPEKEQRQWLLMEDGYVNISQIVAVTDSLTSPGVSDLFDAILKARKQVGEDE